MKTLMARMHNANVWSVVFRESVFTYTYISKSSSDPLVKPSDGIIVDDQTFHGERTHEKGTIENCIEDEETRINY